VTSVVVALVAALVAAVLASLAPRVVAGLPPSDEPPDEPPHERAGDPRSLPGESFGPSVDVFTDADGDVVTAADPGAHPTGTSPEVVGAARPAAPAGAAAPVDWPTLARTRGLGGWSAAVAATAAGTVALVLGPDPAVPAWTALAVVGTWLGWIDWRTRLLPKRLVIPAYLVVGVSLLVAGLSHDRDALVRSAYGWIGTFGVYALLWLVYPRGLGYGDVRLSGVLGMALGWIGWSALVVGTYAGFLLGAVIGGLLAMARVVDRRGYPFGPFMLLGAWLGAVTSPWTLGWF